jgi:signal peptidase complex subunit 2
MGKKKSGKQQQAEATSDAKEPSASESVVSRDHLSATNSAAADGTGNTTSDNDDFEEEELELLQVDLGDIVKIKQIMDETVAGTLLEHIPEDYKWDNFKLGIMAIACSFAMMAQFAPVPFPDSRPILGICGTLYFVFSGILQLITTFIDQDAILWTLPIPDSSNKDMQKRGLVVRTSLERYSEWYSVTIELQKDKKKAVNDTSALTNKSSKAANPSTFVFQRWSIGQFFDKEGYFDEIGVSLEVEKLFKRFEAGEYDKKIPALNEASKGGKSKKD